VYSRSKLSYASDKLVALAGISQVMRKKINSRYLAGLWEGYLASQLTWRVDPTFEYSGEPGSSERVLKFSGTRPAEYRAPSFSRAAVNADNGVRYGEVTARARLLEVGQWDVTIKDQSSAYGLLEDRIVKMVELSRKQTENGTRFTWSLVDVQDPVAVKVATGLDLKEFRKEQFENIYLDTPDTDVSPALCVPVGHDYEDYLECLLLRPRVGGMRHPEKGEFQRIGLVRVPSYHQALQKDLERKHSGNERCCKVEHCEWEPDQSMHSFRLV
jgi:hypothetical protein